MSTRKKSKKHLNILKTPKIWETKINEFPGVGVKTAATFKEKGIETVGTLI